MFKVIFALVTAPIWIPMVIFGGAAFALITGVSPVVAGFGIFMAWMAVKKMERKNDRARMGRT